jgi:hypothetical protein
LVAAAAAAGRDRVWGVIRFQSSLISLGGKEGGGSALKRARKSLSSEGRRSFGARRRLQAKDPAAARKRTTATAAEILRMIRRIPRGSAKTLVPDLRFTVETFTPILHLPKETRPLTYSHPRSLPEMSVQAHPYRGGDDRPMSTPILSLIRGCSTANRCKIIL